jgi:hypothetical protein
VPVRAGGHPRPFVPEVARTRSCRRSPAPWLEVAALALANLRLSFRAPPQGRETAGISHLSRRACRRRHAPRPNFAPASALQDDGPNCAWPPTSFWSCFVGEQGRSPGGGGALTGATPVQAGVAEGRRRPALPEEEGTAGCSGGGGIPSEEESL